MLSGLTLIWLGVAVLGHPRGDVAGGLSFVRWALLIWPARGSEDTERWFDGDGRRVMDRNDLCLDGGRLGQYVAAVIDLCPLRGGWSAGR